MIRITIGSADQEYASVRDVDESWINQHVNRRKDDDRAVCVRVRIQQNGIRMRLSTPACGEAGGRRPPTRQERAILDLWDKCELKDGSFSGGNVVSFFKQLKKILA